MRVIYTSSFTDGTGFFTTITTGLIGTFPDPQLQQVAPLPASLSQLHFVFFLSVCCVLLKRRCQIYTVEPGSSWGAKFKILGTEFYK